MITDNPARLVYGTIVAGALLAAESAKDENYREAVASVVIALIVYWLAHTYADMTGERLISGGRLSLKGVLRSAMSELAILLGAVPPLAMLIVLWIAGASLADALSAAVYTCAGTMVLVEITAGVRSELRGWDLVGQIAFGVVLGFLVVVLKIVLH